MANKITTVLDLDGKGFTSQIKAVQTSVREADGAMGKLKAGASGLGGMMKANLAEGAMAAAAAFATFAVKGVQAFQSLALESGKFSDATGVSVEEASRLAEVAGDLGIEVGSVQGALQRFNRAAADGEVTIDNFGNAVVRAKDGTVDAYESFINAATAIGAIEDPTLRTQKAQEVFGRSFAEIAELMAMDAEELREALASVSDQKVITDGELQQAKDFRAAWDELKDKFEDAQHQIGGGLVPMLTDLATAVSDVDAALAELSGEDGGGLAGLMMAGYEQSGLKDLADGLDAINYFVGNNKDEVEGATAANEANSDAADDMASANDRAASSFRNAGGAARGAAGDIERMYEARGLAAQEERAANLRDRLQEVVRELGGIPAEKYVEINTQLNEGNLAAAEAAINTLARSRVAQIVVSVGAAMGGAMGKLGTGIAGGVAAGAKMGSSIFAKAIFNASQAASSGGGGGGGGATKSPAELEVEAWDAAMEKMLDYGEITRQQYIDYLNMRMEGEDKFSEEYYRYWKIRQGLEVEIAREEADRQRDRERAEKEAADEAKRRAEELKRAAEESAKASEQLTINVYSNSLDPMAVARAIEQAKKMAGRGFLQ